MTFKIEWAELDNNVASNFFTHCENLRDFEDVRDLNPVINEVLIPFNGVEHTDPFHLEFQSDADYTFFILRFS